MRQTLKVSFARLNDFWQDQPAMNGTRLPRLPLGPSFSPLFLAAILLALSGLACRLGMAPQTPLATPAENPLLSRTSGTEPVPPTQTAPSAAASQPVEPALPPAPSPVPVQPIATQPQAQSAAGLFTELYFGGGGAGEQGCAGEDPPPARDWPALLDLGRLEQAPDGVSMYPDYDFGTLCLYGFLPGETISLSAVSPAGRVFAGERQAGDPLSVTPDGIPFVEISLREPVGLPLGEWAFSARSASVQVQGSFEVTPFRYPEISLVEEPEVNPFGSGFVAGHFYGEEITVLGDGFPPGDEVPVGVYRQTGRTSANGDQVAVLVASALLQAGPEGRLEIAWQTDAGEPPGVDCLIAVVNPEAQHMYLAGPFLCVSLK